MPDDLIIPSGGRDLQQDQGGKYPALVYLASLGPGSRRTMRETLNTLAQALGAVPQELPNGQDVTGVMFPWGDVRYGHAAFLRSWLMEHYAPATVNKMLSALRGVLKQAWLLGLMTAEEYQRAAQVKNVSGHGLQAGRALSTGELAALVDTCRADRSPAGARDAALVAVMYLAGLRRGSVVALDVDDYDPQTGDLKIRTAKGGKPYIARLVDPGGAGLLEDWIMIRGLEPGPMFYPVNKGGNIERRRLSTTALYKILDRRGMEAGIEQFSPHDLRRSMASHLLDRGADIATVQKLMNHSNVTTTANYDRRGDETQRKAAALLHLPRR